MAKRFTDSQKWDDPWFRSMSSANKCFWQFILDKCDNTGVWKKDFEMAEFCTGEKFDEQESFRIFNKDKERIIVLNCGSHWLVKDFITFQFGRLSKLCKPHVSIIDLVEKHTLSKGYPRGIHTLEEKEKEKEKEKDNTGEPVNNCELCGGSGVLLTQHNGKTRKCSCVH